MTMSYSQRNEDLILQRCFADQPSGFYIDIGAGHPVYDNVTFAFYPQGWRGITVEPNPWLARLSREVRPRDRSLQMLVGAAEGEAPFYLVDEFHGLSTTDPSHAAQAQAQFGKSSEALVLPMTTLGALCERDAPADIDFLKVDVEGAEKDVLAGGDWKRFRPKLVMAEALAPYSLAPAWAEWEALLTAHDYRYAGFDTLNRYYIAAEATQLADRFESATEAYSAAVRFREIKPAAIDAAHPDHALALLLTQAALTRLPVFDRSLLLDLVTADISAAEMARPARPDDRARAAIRLFGTVPAEIVTMRLAAGASVRDLYAALVDSDAFRVRCGRISASYAW